MLIVVKICEKYISNDPSDTLVAYSLGSCLGISCYDPESRIGGLANCMLPLSRIDTDRALLKPCMFTDSGLLSLLQEMYKLGANKDRLLLKVAGASSMIDQDDTFKIGERNYMVLLKVLEKNNLQLVDEDIRGSNSRTLTLDIDTGKTTVKSAGREKEL